jgi:serine/threonine protein kinase
MKKAVLVTMASNRLKALNTGEIEDPFDTELGGGEGDGEGGAELRQRMTEVKMSMNLKQTKGAKGEKLINDFEVLRLLGQGSYGKVMLCKKVLSMGGAGGGKKGSRMPQHFDSRGVAGLGGAGVDGNLFAIKIIDKSILLQAHKRNMGRAKDADPLEEVKTEIAIMKKLYHKHVINLEEVIDDPAADKMYLVEEYASGGPIMEGLECKPLSEADAFKHFRGLCLGVEYLHYQGVIHRDIKPENLLVGEDGEIRIADFGVARLVEKKVAGDGGKGQVVKPKGTPAFMAPELLCGEALMGVEAAADVWSLGATLYMLVYGTPPWMADNEIILAERVIKDELAFPGNEKGAGAGGVGGGGEDGEGWAVDPHLQNLLTRMLTKDPSKRITLPQVMNHEWVTREGSQPLESLYDVVPHERAPSCRSTVSIDESQSAVKPAVKFSIKRWITRARNALHSAVASNGEAVEARPLSHKASKKKLSKKASKKAPKKHGWKNSSKAVDGSSSDGGDYSRPPSMTITGPIGLSPYVVPVKLGKGGSEAKTIEAGKGASIWSSLGSSDSGGDRLSALCASPVGPHVRMGGRGGGGDSRTFSNSPNGPPVGALDGTGRRGLVSIQRNDHCMKRALMAEVIKRHGEEGAVKEGKGGGLQRHGKFKATKVKMKKGQRRGSTAGIGGDSMQIIKRIGKKQSMRLNSGEVAAQRGRSTTVSRQRGLTTGGDATGAAGATGAKEGESPANSISASLAKFSLGGGEGGDSDSDSSSSYGLGPAEGSDGRTSPAAGGMTKKKGGLGGMSGGMGKKGGLSKMGGGSSLKGLLKGSSKGSMKGTPGGAGGEGGEDDGLDGMGASLERSPPSTKGRSTVSFSEPGDSVDEDKSGDKSDDDSSDSDSSSDDDFGDEACELLDDDDGLMGMVRVHFRIAHSSF